MQTIRENIEQGLGEKRIGPFAHALLYALSLAYGAGVRARAALYHTGIIRSKKLPCKVISVGNITVGGSGKTPMVVHIAERLSETGLRVLVLSRGYKRSGSGTEVVADGEKVLLDPRRAGDEPYLMATRLDGVPVMVGTDRVEAGLCGIERFSPDVIILDDAFQHLRIKRDLDIMLVDSRRGFGSGYLLPRGPLREPLSGINRADIVMIKGEGEFRLPWSVAQEKPVFRFSYIPKGLVGPDGELPGGVDRLRGRMIAALAGIADPASFFQTLERLGAVVTKTLAYPDHHWYTADDAERIKREADGTELLVTTEKDLARLDVHGLGEVPVAALVIDVDVEDAERFLTLVRKKLGLQGS